MLEFDNPLIACVEISVVSASINHKHKQLIKSHDVPLFNTQYIYRVQVTIIDNSFVTTQWPAHNAQRTLKLKIIRPVSARKARGPGFSGPARGRPGPLPSLLCGDVVYTRLYYVRVVSILVIRKDAFMYIYSGHFKYWTVWAINKNVNFLNSN